MAEPLLSESLEPDLSICYSQRVGSVQFHRDRNVISTQRGFNRQRWAIGEGIPGKREDMCKDTEGFGAEVKLSDL